LSNARINLLEISYLAKVLVAVVASLVAVVACLVASSVAVEVCEEDKLVQFNPRGLMAMYFEGVWPD
jgi:hypothetical protein